MKFVDSVRISVKAGRGGNGCMSFLRERFKPNGGPDGGNGGKGGSIIFEATNNLQTLADLEYQRNIKGSNGSHGKGSARNGAAGEDIILYVPCGTLIYDAETGDGLADLVEPKDRFLAARGGRGGGTAQSWRTPTSCPFMMFSSVDASSTRMGLLAD